MFVEEAALYFLALKDYDCSKAVDSMVKNVDEVITLMRTLYNRFHVSAFYYLRISEIMLNLGNRIPEHEQSAKNGGPAKNSAIGESAVGSNV